MLPILSNTACCEVWLHFWLCWCNRLSCSLKLVLIYICLFEVICMKSHLCYIWELIFFPFFILALYFFYWDYFIHESVILAIVIWIKYVTNTFLTFDYTVLSWYLSSLNFYVFTFFWCYIIIAFCTKLLHFTSQSSIRNIYLSFLPCLLFKIVVVSWQNLLPQEVSDLFCNGWKESSCSGLRPNTFPETFLKLNENTFTETKG